MSVNLGWVLRQEGDPDGARSMFGAGLRTAAGTGTMPASRYASLGLACLAADRGDWHRAAVLHGVAQAFLDRAGEPWEELEARYRRESLDDVRARLGDDQADRAYAEGMALSVDAALDLARGQLTAPDPRQPPEPPGLAQLSARERELVILVARGATDAQIAAQLYISVSTVRSHLDRIRDKTGCRRRADLTRLALQAGLVEPATRPAAGRPGPHRRQAFLPPRRTGRKGVTRPLPRGPAGGAAWHQQAGTGPAATRKDTRHVHPTHSHAGGHADHGPGV